VYQPSEDLVLSATVLQDDDQQVIEGLSLRRIAWRRLKQDRVAMAGGVVLVLIVLVAGFASQLNDLLGQQPGQFHSSLIDPDTTLPYRSLGGVSIRHWLGVEPTNGRDLLARLIAGCRTSLLISGASTLVSLVLGVVTGVVAGYYGRAVDALLTFLFDILLTIPGLLLAIALVELLSQAPRFLWLSGEDLSVALLIFIIGFGGFPYLARLVRGQVLSLRQKEFTEAARSLGAGDLRILTRELMPNLMGPLLVWVSLTIPAYILAESALSYLGIGVRPPTASWGGMLSTAQQYYQADPMYLFCPGCALFVTVLAFNLFGDGLRDAFDPKSSQ
ncbi:MAG TPA: ABC transporter permease, partial [Jatrophihabitans sp.]|nr:ABC transporter permease [Jatrophihabitans sp.]